MTQNQISEVIQGGTNVFEDLGFAPEEALNLKIRADLMLNIKRFIQSQGWTQKQAALFFGETQPRISDLINGDIERFSIDKLVMMLVRAGMDVKFEVNSFAIAPNLNQKSIASIINSSNTQAIASYLLLKYYYVTMPNKVC